MAMSDASEREQQQARMVELSRYSWHLRETLLVARHLTAAWFAGGDLDERCAELAHFLGSLHEHEQRELSVELQETLELAVRVIDCWVGGGDPDDLCAELERRLDALGVPGGR